MAANNYWADSAVEAGKRGAAPVVSGGRIVTVCGTFEKAAGDGDGSVIKLFKLPANAIPIRGELNNDALAGCTDVDFGVYEEDGVTVADKDLFLDGADINAGKAIGSEQNLLANLGGADPVANIGKRLWELLGLTVKTKKEGYIAALTLNTAGAAAGTISWRFSYILA